jgi:hypothetical protein
MSNEIANPCEYDKTMHRGLKVDQVNYKDVMWHRFEMRCKKCGKLFGIYNQKTMVKEYFDMIYAPNVDPEENSVMNTDPRMKSARIQREVRERNTEHHDH